MKNNEKEQENKLLKSVRTNTYCLIQFIDTKKTTAIGRIHKKYRNNKIEVITM